MKTFEHSFLDSGTELHLALTNVTANTLRSVEILTIFLKDEVTPGGGPSQAHIRFAAVDSMHPKKEVVLSHQIWINGKPVAGGAEIERLKTVAGVNKPYVLDISWQDPLGKTCFQRIPIGH